MNQKDDHRDYWNFDLYGEPIRRIKDPRGEPDHDLGRFGRSRLTHPYSYDPETVWGDPYPPTGKNLGSNYTDRLSTWKYKEYREAATRLGVCFQKGRVTGDAIQQMLRELLDLPKLELLRVIEFCNAATGYPTWCCVYRTEPE